MLTPREIELTLNLIALAKSGTINAPLGMAIELAKQVEAFEKKLQALQKVSELIIPPDPPTDDETVPVPVE